MSITKKSYRLLTVLSERAQRGPRMFRVYARKVNARGFDMLASIRAEIAPKVAALHVLDTVGESIEEIAIAAPSVRKGWTWGKVGKMGKRGAAVTFNSIGSIPSNLAFDNEPNFAFIQNGMDAASETAMHA